MQENKFARRPLNPDHPASAFTAADTSLPFVVPAKKSSDGSVGGAVVRRASKNVIPLSKISYVSSKRDSVSANQPFR